MYHILLQGGFFMCAKKERRRRRPGRKESLLAGVGVGSFITVGLCLIIAAAISSEKISENDAGLFAVAAMAIGTFFGSLIAAKIADIKLGLTVCAIFTAVRIIVGAFSDGRMFGKTAIVTLVFMIICGFVGAAIGGRRVKRRRA